MFMSKRKLAGALLALCLLTGRAAAADDDVTLFRVFLKDGGTLVSYGEFARVGDRVVFSMPTAATVNPPLHLVTMSAALVDWQRTSQYADAARASHYVATRAEDDYTRLTDEVARTLNRIAQTPSASQRLAIVENARRTLAEWPAAHYNYRHSEVREMLQLLDEAIADLRAASGGERFDLSFVAYSDPPPNPMRVMPSPTPKEAIEQTLLAARVVDEPAERVSLLSAAVSGIDSTPGLPAAWANETRSAAAAEIASEVAADQDYKVLTDEAIRSASDRAKAADVRGIERIVTLIKLRDTALGHRRPETVAALIDAVNEQLDAARRLRLALGRWALRGPVLRKYDAEMRRPLTLFARMQPALDDIKSLAGSTPAALWRVRQTVSQIVAMANDIVPPDETRAAHALLVSAVQMADNAARLRREAAMSGDLTRAWDASSAAAGAMMLGERARSEIEASLRPPDAR